MINDILQNVTTRPNYYIYCLLVILTTTTVDRAIVSLLINKIDIFRENIFFDFGFKSENPFPTSTTIG